MYYFREYLAIEDIHPNHTLVEKPSNFRSLMIDIKSMSYTHTQTHINIILGHIVTHFHFFFYGKLQIFLTF